MDRFRPWPAVPATDGFPPWPDLLSTGGHRTAGGLAGRGAACS